MTKFLNLDEIKPEIAKTVVINGVKHVHKPATMGDMIANLKEAKALAEKISKKKLSPEEQTQLAIESVYLMIQRAFPTVTDEIVNELSGEQIAALRRFIEADAEEAAKEATDEEGNG